MLCGGVKAVDGVTIVGVVLIDMLASLAWQMALFDGKMVGLDCVVVWGVVCKLVGYCVDWFALGYCAVGLMRFVGWLSGRLALVFDLLGD